VRGFRVSWPSPAMAVSLVALVVALGGTAYAVHRINGASIAKRSIPGNRLVMHSIGAKEVNKGRLGKVVAAGAADNALRLGGIGASGFLSSTGTAVNASKLGGTDPAGFLSSTGTAANASKLGGIDPTGFLQGQGHASFGVADAPVSAAATDCGATVTRVRIIDVPGFGFVDGYCSNYNSGTPICSFSFHDTAGVTFTGMTDAFVGGQGLGPFAPSIQFEQVASGATIDEGTNLPVERVLWQIGLGGQTPRVMTAIVTQAHPNTGATSCHFDAQAMAQGV
jgi:hypothetical protein